MRTGYTEIQVFRFLAEVYGKKFARPTRERMDAMWNILTKMHLPAAREGVKEEPCISAYDMITAENTVRAVREFGLLLTRSDEERLEKEGE